MPITRRILGAALLAVTGGWLSACDVNIGVNAGGVTAHDRKQYTVSGKPEVTLNTFDGAIEVRAWDRPEVSIDIEKRATDQEALNAIQITSEQSGNKISFDAKYPKRASDMVHIGFSMSPSVRLVVSVPRETDLSVTSGDGGLVIERVTGRVELHTGDGVIKGTDLAGELKAHTGDGAMTFEGINGRVDIETGDGGVKLSGKLQGLRLKTGDGSVWIRADVGSAMADDWEVRTGDGSVALELPPVFDADLDADASDGLVHLQNLDVAAGRGAHAFRGKIGSGGHTLRLRTNDGTITVGRIR
jgi:hypothetical protein